MNPLALKDLSLSKVLINLETYGELLGTLPPLCKQQVLDHVDSPFDCKASGLKALLPLFSSKTVTVRSLLLQKILQGKHRKRENEAQIEEFVNRVTHNAPNIEYLELPSREEYNIGENTVNAISKLQHLQYLFIDGGSIDLTLFAQIASECTSLKRIEARRVIIDVYLGVLNSCQRFAYQIIGSYAPEYALDITMSTELPPWVESHEKVHRKLEISTSNPPEVEIFAAYSLLTHLRIMHFLNYEGEGLFDILNWPELRSVRYNIEGICMCTKDRFFWGTLEKYGANLEKLEYRNPSPSVEIQYEKLFRLCPNLRSLCLEVPFLSGDAPIVALRQLREITVKQRVHGCRSSIALSSLLRAPKLEILTVHVDILNVSDIEKILKMIRSSNEGLLRNLKSVNFRPIFFQRRSRGNIRELIVNRLRDALGDKFRFI